MKRQIVEELMMEGQADIVADTNGEGYIRIDGSYLASVLKACGGMVDFSFTNALSPMLFSSNGYKVVVMPMITDKAKAKAEPTEQATVEAEPTEPESKATEQAKPKKAKRSRKKEKVAVA